MNDKEKELSKLLVKYGKYNPIAWDLKVKINELIIEVYGFHYSDKDMDQLIDMLDYGSSCSFKYLDEQMKEYKNKPSASWMGEDR